ncbi:hypothetical protein E4633_02980 [Geomonas terrae]|uniref:SsuA/THI5-like domain-containing protein n=1 Tax=Geomonas terrae TaxID=2562681 RepID=A0A4S1CL18_9BACT|nr:ABC transporter substrate-binding protein [Geomonas terrae]TGU74444.1 hypothetical protein E4633_02980 [Geomonas terrae]
MSASPARRACHALLRFRRLHLALVVLLVLVPAAVPAKPVPLGFSYQPLASPGGALAAALQHDRILREALARQGFQLTMLPVRDGSEAITQLSQGRVALATMGDMPFIKAVASGMPLCAVTLLKQNYVSVIGPKGMMAADLKGKRIGNTFGTTGHFALMKTLAGSGLSEADAVLVPMEVNEMEDALLKGEIDAYAAWAPTPELTLARYPDRFTAIGKQKSIAFLAMSAKVAELHPEVPRLLAAALTRALMWVERDRGALQKVARWNAADIAALNGKALPTAAQARLAQDLRPDLKAVGRVPRLPRGIEADGSSLCDEFLFLKKLGKVPASVQWAMLKGSFKFEYLDQVMKNPKQYRITRFDYD